MKRRVVLIWAGFLAVIGLLAVSAPAHAGAATDVVKAKQTLLFEVLRKPQSPETKKRIESLFDEMLDYAALAEASLGTEWAPRTDAERAEFSDILKQLVRKAYEKNLRKTIDFDIAYVGEAADGPAMVVKTKATSHAKPNDEPILIDFKMLEKDSAWKVQDIATEGVSLVGSYRSQFTRIIKKDGFPALLKKMKEKLAKGDVDAGN